ncbi:VRK1 [Cordylochernes scorpioides]|uniref:non-specific serine/threonine protein kinase n=1 Tax=Cordylochernes scorpioides TaxID=51811 RepID=A0ABY6LFA8_9ARAC|nr:VRK1 [Cordylochernes scorpioides]
MPWCCAVDEWMKKKKLNFLGMPRFIGNGSHERGEDKYRFMVMDRFGEDLQKVLDRCKGRFPLKAVYTIGIKVSCQEDCDNGVLQIDVLEYIHQFGYIHADVKPSNLLLGYGPDAEKQVYLVDFGLACKFIVNDKHKEYKEDLRKAHDGTIEYTSRDAHIGVHARRSDLEILGYNLLHWLAGKLPWLDKLKSPVQVAQQKNKLVTDSIPPVQNHFIRYRSTRAP